MARTSLRRSVLFSLVMVLVVLGTAEGMARWLAGDALELAASPLPQAQEGAPNLVGNPYLLFEMAPGDRLENDIHVAINRLGLRGPEWSIEKPPGVRRIMAVGDSSVYGFGVHDGEVFTSRLDTALGDHVQVINAAVPGYSTYQTINLLQIRALALQPDLLVIGSIWSDNNFDSFVDADLLAAYSSFRNRRGRALKELLQRSAIFHLLDYKLRVLRQFPAERRVGWMVGRGEKIGKRRVPIQEYARNLETMVELAHEASAEVAFMVLPNREDILSAYASGAAWDPYRGVMLDTAERHGAPVLDLPSLFRGTGESADDLFLDEMHPTAEGHAIWAAALQQLLMDHGWAEGEALEGAPHPGPIPAYEDSYVEGAHTPPVPPVDPAAQAVPAVSPGGPRIQGEVVAPADMAGTPLQIDAVTTGAGPGGVVGTMRAPRPGPFSMELSAQVARVSFQVYLDAAGDGPSAGDPRIDLYPEGLEIPAEGLAEIVLDLDRGLRLDTFSGSATPQPDGPPPGLPPKEVPAAGGPIVTDQVGTGPHAVKVPAGPKGAIITDQADNGKTP
ncbi:MAG: SGNH/GDSL hydrolase family protein [Pseudomonadota bacterium]